MRALNVVLSIAISALMAFLALELGLRLLGMGPPASILEFDAHTGWKKRANAEIRRKGPEYDVTLRTNEFGLADDPMSSPKKPAGTFRVLALGDSFTQGFTVERKDLYVDLLEQRWQAEGRAVDVVNAGTEGWSTDQQVAWFLQNGAQFEPDLVLIASYENDLYWNGQASYVDGGQQKPLFRADGTLEVALCADPGPQPWTKCCAVTRFLGGFFASNPELAKHTFVPPGAGQPTLKEFAPLLNARPEFLQRSLEGTKGALVALAAECQKLGAQVRLVAIPSHSAIDPSYAPRFAEIALGGLATSQWSADKPVDTFKALAQEAGIAALDPRAALRDAHKSTPQYFDIDWHLDPNGNRTLANFLHAELDPLVSAAQAAKSQVAPHAGVAVSARRGTDWTFVGGLFAVLWLVLSGVFVTTYADEKKPAALVKVGGMLALVFVIFLCARELLRMVPGAYAGWIGAAFVLGILGFVAYKLGRRVGTILELLRSFTLRGHWYLMPLLVVLLTIGSLLVVAASSPLIAPFIYTLF